MTLLSLRALWTLTEAGKMMYLYVYDQLKSAATKCRSAKGDCDLPEYCDGISPSCPSDVYKRNTEPCTVETVCYYMHTCTF